MGKGSKRRPCQISHVEEDLRWKLALGEITFHKWCSDMQKLKVEKDSKGVCNNCLDGMLADPEGNYKVICRHDNVMHHQWDTCEKFKEA